MPVDLDSRLSSPFADDFKDYHFKPGVCLRGCDFDRIRSFMVDHVDRSSMGSPSIKGRRSISRSKGRIVPGHGPQFLTPSIKGHAKVVWRHEIAFSIDRKLLLKIRSPRLPGPQMHATMWRNSGDRVGDTIENYNREMAPFSGPTRSQGAD